LRAQLLISILLLAGAAVAQRPLLLTDLSSREAQSLSDRLRERGLSVDVEALADSDLKIRIKQDPKPSLLFAVDGFDLFDLIEGDVLRPIPAALTADLQPFWRDSESRVLITMAEPWVIAFSATAWADRSLPSRFDELANPHFEGQLSLPIPRNSRALWTGWIQDQLRQGYSEERAFAWLASLDARVLSYQADSEACIAALRSGLADVSVLPLYLVVEEQRRGGSLLYKLPEPAIPVRGRGLALLVEADASMRKLIDFLLQPNLALSLAREQQLIPCPREGLAMDEIPALLREISARAIPVLPNFGNSDGWLRRWEEEVRGQGRPTEQLDSLLDFVLGLGFFGLLIYVFLRSRNIDDRP